MKDIIGKALLDYHSGEYSEDIVTWTDISDTDILPLPHLFRDFSSMPLIEQKALSLCKGKVLDVGCGSGSHALYLQEKGFSVKGIDISKGAIKVARERGVKDIELVDVLKVTDCFDTILLLMNGTGIFQEYEQLGKYLNHLKSILNSKGQILIDSTDIKYMFVDDDNPNSFKEWRKVRNRYYGELDYFMSYKGEEESPIKWLFLDFKSLKNACNSLGLKCEKVVDGEYHDYLVRIF